MHLFQRIAKALIEKPQALPAARVEYIPPQHDDALEIGAAFLVRQKRMKAKVVRGLDESIPLVRGEREFAALALRVLTESVQFGWRNYPFYLWTRQIDEIGGWAGWRSLERGFAELGAEPLLVHSRDIYVWEPQDFFLCRLQIVMSKG